MHFTVCDVCYSQFSQQHVSAAISTIFWVILLKRIQRYKYD